MLVRVSANVGLRLGASGGSRICSKYKMGYSSFSVGTLGQAQTKISDT